MNRKEKLFWGGLSLTILGFAAFLVLTPVLEAQTSQTMADERYGQMLTTAMNFILNYYVEEGVDPQVLFDGAMRGMLESLGDPHSAYLTASDLTDLTDTTRGAFGGVGLYINKVPPSSIGPTNPARDYFVEVVAPIEDTPAHRAGILAGDYITHIDGESTQNLTIDEVLEVLRGEPDSSVTVTLLRSDQISFDVELIRAVIEVPTVKFQMLEEGIAYLRIIQFTPRTVDRVQEALEFFARNNYQGMIIDLRSNPGGLLEAVVRVSDQFFSEGPIVSTGSRIPSENRVFSARPPQVVPGNLPIVVLINRGSASASEILAGALRDRERALIVGETSYGKGSVQQVIPFGDAAFKLTMSRYYTPSGVSIDQVGIVPHILLAPPELDEEGMEAYGRILRDRAVFSLLEENPEVSLERMDFLVGLLRDQGYDLEGRLLRRLIRTEWNRIHNVNPPDVDLDFDLVLQESLRMLTAGEVPAQVPLPEAQEPEPLRTSTAPSGL